MGGVKSLRSGVAGTYGNHFGSLELFQTET